MQITSSINSSKYIFIYFMQMVQKNLLKNLKFFIGEIIKKHTSTITYIHIKFRNDIFPQWFTFQDIDLFIYF